MVDPEATPQSQTPLKKRVVDFVRLGFGVSERRACTVLGFWRSTQQYRTQRQDGELAGRLRQLASERPRFGYRRLHVLLRREGMQVNHKRVYRVYRAEGLAVRRRARKKAAAVQRVPSAVPTRPNERWSLDFVHDQLADGRRFRVLNVVDDCTRECLLSHVGTSIPGALVTRLLENIVLERGKPKVLLSDNGPEFTGRALDQWAYQQGIRQDFIDPGKPVQNAFIESFNGRMRDECLNTHWFVTLLQAKATITAWKDDYNAVRPHSSLGQRTPLEFAHHLAATP